MVDALLRSGADETITDDLARCAMDMIGCRVGEDGNTSDDDVSDVEANGIGGNDIDEINRVRQLLANATADRAWRRRGYLVLCRVHPSRVQLGRRHNSVGTPSGGIAPRSPTGARRWQGCHWATAAGPYGIT